MAWNIIRNAQDGEQEKLDEKAQEFAGRHNLSNIQDASDLVGYLSDKYGSMEDSDRKYLLRLWYGVVGRTLKAPGAEGIAYGKVGYSVN